MPNMTPNLSIWPRKCLYLGRSVYTVHLPGSKLSLSFSPHSSSSPLLPWHLGEFTWYWAGESPVLDPLWRGQIYETIYSVLLIKHPFSAVPFPHRYCLFQAMCGDQKKKRDPDLMIC